MLTCEVDSKEKRTNYFHVLPISHLFSLYPHFDPSVSCRLASLAVWVPVVRSGEGGHHHVPPVDVDDVSHGLQDVEVEVGVAGNGAVEAGLEEGGPLFLQHARRAAAVVLTNPGHPRKDDLRTIRTVEMEMIRYDTTRHDAIQYGEMRCDAMWHTIVPLGKLSWNSKRCIYRASTVESAVAQAQFHKNRKCLS